jgi:NADH dehydrogenase
LPVRILACFLRNSWGEWLILMGSRATIGILGGGFGGLYTLFFLRKYVGDNVDVTLFDKNNFLLYTPVLHEMATGTVNARHVVIPLRKVANPREVEIRSEKVTLVDLQAKSLETPSGHFTFDFLVLAHGSMSNFYSIPGAEEYSITFKTIEDAIRVRNTLISILEQGALEKEPEKKRKLLTLSVAGGGCTGIEVVTEIAQFINTILKKDYPEIKRSEVRILLIEAVDRILPSFPRYLSDVAMARLKGMGVEVLLDAPIQQVNREWVELKDGRVIPRGLLVWAAGVKSQVLYVKPEVKCDQSRRIIVDERLEIPGYPGVYAIGDGSEFSCNGSPLPPTASVAVQEAQFIAKDMAARIREKERYPFQFHYRGDMASLGFMFGVAEIYGRRFKGAVAWFIWKAFKLGMLPRYKNRLQIMADWLITLLFNRDTSKLM